MGTSKFVFFYAAPFRYPNVACGFLFRPSLEIENTATASASPFDSGGLVDFFDRRDPVEPLRDFLARHELPIPDHRRYLSRSMDALFLEPMHYIQGRGPHSAGPIGLKARVPEADQRIWTHEVRIPSLVRIQTRHLQAVFAPRGLVRRNATLRTFFKWCANRDVDTIMFEALGNNNFEQLQRMPSLFRAQTKLEPEMVERIQIDGLEIIGYADSLTEDMVPAIVPPVFRSKHSPDRVFVPPYHMNRSSFTTRPKSPSVNSGTLPRLEK